VEIFSIPNTIQPGTLVLSGRERDGRESGIGAMIIALQELTSHGVSSARNRAARQFSSEERALSTMAMYEMAEPKLISRNFSKTGVIRPPKGLVVHVTDGARTLPALFNFFSLREQKLRDGSSTRSSSHFGIGKEGTIWQFVDTDHQAFAQGPGAPAWISVEHCGVIGEALTDEQIESVGNILSWLHGIYPSIPLRLAKNARDIGLAYHSIDTSWSKSGRCPGEPVIAQLPRIVEFALAGY